MPDLVTVGGGGRWVQSEKDTILKGSIPVGTPADTWVTVTMLNEECLVLYAGVKRNAGSNGTTSIKVLRDGSEFGELSSSTLSNAVLVGDSYNYAGNGEINGNNLTLHCKTSLEIQVKNSAEVGTAADGLYSIKFSKGKML